MLSALCEHTRRILSPGQSGPENWYMELLLLNLPGPGQAEVAYLQIT